MDAQEKKIYVNSRVVANILPKSGYSSTIYKKKKSLTKCYRHASIEEVEKKRYIPFYDHFFEDALKVAVNTGTVVIGKKKKYKKKYSQKK